MRYNNGLFWAGIAFVLFAGVCGCATQATTERLRPAKYNAGSARMLSLVQVTGRPDLQNLLVNSLRHQVTARNWWTFRDARAGRVAIVDNAGAGQAVIGGLPQAGEIYLRIDAYDSQVFPIKEKHDDHRSRDDRRDKRDDDRRDGLRDRRDHDRHDRRPESSEGIMRVRFAATVVTHDGRVLMNRHEYVGSVRGKIKGRIQRSRLVSAAATNGVQSLLWDISPRMVRERVVLDKDAEDMKPIAQFVAEGRYAEAANVLQEMRTREPHRADVAYNLAVLNDVSGDYEKALDLYDQAIKLGYKSYYSRSRAACERRLLERDSLK